MSQNVTSKHMNKKFYALKCQIGISKERNPKDNFVVRPSRLHTLDINNICTSEDACTTEKWSQIATTSGLYNWKT